MIREFFNWAEVWTLLIPLPFILWNKTKLPEYLKPVKIFVFVALLIHIAAIMIWRFKDNWGIQEGDLLWSNNFLYNTLAIVRLLLFSWFFILLKQPFMVKVKKIIPVVFCIFFLVYFLFFKPYFDNIFSGLLLTSASALLLFYCVQYFIYLVIEDRTVALIKQPGFWVVTGLSIYTAASFFIFLFYQYMVEQKLMTYAIRLWDTHNIALLILCLFLARAFYGRPATNK